MNNYQSMLNTILQNSAQVDRDAVKRVLILYEDKSFYIGDSVLRFEKLKICRAFFVNAAIDINFTNDKHTPRYRDLLHNNPNVDSVGSLTWEEIAFENYDVVMCVTYGEIELAEFLDRKYGDQFRNQQLKLAVFSTHNHILRYIGVSKTIFPDCSELFGHADYFAGDNLRQLYVGADEQEWADEWLRANGLKENENLFIVLDSSSQRSKLLKIDTYFTVLKALLSFEDARVLIYDENNAGKEAFYHAWLGDECARKIIFAKQLGLRQDIRLLSSRYVKLVLGPCTGLMHCASGIYNHLVHKGMPAGDVPLIVTYTGKYEPGKNAYYWWRNSPLVDCLMLRNESGRLQMVVLNDLPEAEKEAEDNQVACPEYTAQMLLNFLYARYQARTLEDAGRLVEKY